MRGLEAYMYGAILGDIIGSISFKIKCDKRH